MPNTADEDEAGDVMLQDLALAIKGACQVC